jgi:hypothetical protein
MTNKYNIAQFLILIKANEGIGALLLMNLLSAIRAKFKGFEYFSPHLKIGMKKK